MNLHLMTHLFIHIKQLAGILDKPVSMLSGGAMQNYTVIEDAFLLVENGLIADYGTMDELAQKNYLHKLPPITSLEKLYFPLGVTHIHTLFMPETENRNLWTASTDSPTNKLLKKEAVF